MKTPLILRVFYFYLPNRVKLQVPPRDIKGALTVNNTTFFLTDDTWYESPSSFEEVWLSSSTEDGTYMYATFKVNNWYDIMSEVRTKWPELRLDGK
jgi:hypothetical protein